jgi:alkylation response protein AidB-like acyl-CoA dehydrogenase
MSTTEASAGPATPPPSAGPGTRAALPLQPTEEETLLRATVAAIVGRYGNAYYRRMSAAGEPMRELWADLGAGGYLGLNIPEEHGGGGAGLTEQAIVVEETCAGGCPGLGMVLSQGIVGSVLVRHGTPAQKRRFLPGIAAGTERFSFALTEPDAGSNSHKLTTTARRDGADWVVNGAKYYISAVDHADHLLLVARTGEDARGRGQLSLFALDPNSPGLSRELIPTALDAPERQFSLFFDDVRMPADALIGVEGRGLHAVFDGLNPERVISAVLCTGTARYALEKATRYAKERNVWGVPIGTHQAVAHPLADSAMELEAAQLMVWRAAAMYDAGLPADQVGEACNMAKYLASKVGMQTLERAIQVHGGNGLALEYGLANLWGLMRLQQIGPVSTEMVLNNIAQSTLGLPRSY